MEAFLKRGQLISFECKDFNSGKTFCKWIAVYLGNGLARKVSRGKKSSDKDNFLLDNSKNSTTCTRINLGWKFNRYA